MKDCSCPVLSGAAHGRAAALADNVLTGGDMPTASSFPVQWWRAVHPCAEGNGSRWQRK